ncbi:MAG: ABC transporter permease subunit [Alphaproteobacteria bacterium]
MAEVVRGGLAAIPKGQREAAAALGLGYWKTTALITMPQALKVSLPPSSRPASASSEDTSLISIMG